MDCRFIYVNGVLKMKRHIISVGSITFAIKGRDYLRKRGYKAHTEKKTNSNGGVGCGYVIIADGDTENILSALKAAGIKIMDISYK